MNRPPAFQTAPSVCALLAIALSTVLSAQSPITVGDLVVVRLGTGASGLSGSAAPTFLDEVTTAGTPVQTISMPTAASGANFALTNSGSATSEAYLNQSSDGRYLLLGGYDAAPGTAAVATSTGPVRVCGRVDVSTGTVDTSTSTTAFVGLNIRSVASATGNDFYAAGSNNGVQYFGAVGATSSVQIENTPGNCRVVQIVLGQLLTTSASGTFLGICAVGSGVPTTGGQVTTLLPGMGASGTGNPSNYDYFFSDPATVYVADDRTVATGGGIQKWTFNGTAWSRAYTLPIHASVGARSITGDISGPFPVLYATTAEASLNHIVTITDTGGGAPFTNIAQAAANTIFRGLRLIKNGPSASTYGYGCAGTGGLTPVMAANGLPYLGNTGFGLNISQAAPLAPAFLFGSIGIDPIGTPLGGSCTVFLDLNSALSLITAGLFPIPGLTDGNGDAAISFPLPYLPFFAGTVLGVQTLVNDGASVTGFALSNPVAILLNP